MNNVDADFSDQKIVFLGCGSMGEAIMAGLIGTGFDSANILATTRGQQGSKRLMEKYGVKALAADTQEADASGRGVNAEAAAQSDIVLIGVKPEAVKAVAEEISPVLPAKTIVLSIAASVPVKLLEALLPVGQPVVRAMPNTPLMVGRGVVGLSAGTYCGTDDMERAQQIFSNSGTVVVIPEQQQDIISAVSGSGPAYVFYLAEALSHAAQSLGLDRNIADIIAQDTVAGAGVMLDQPHSSPEQLRKAVTSPKGTTEHAIEVFSRQGLFDMVLAAAQASIGRSAEISAELEE